ncbi:cellular nucleic acid binding protein, putative [Ricinus communis]|uniref:Cellular nucleic acid binding protein, putative n=1 Tax=Ricinus communis TaxID=3988 RepID=B9T030_RICCO|nr:cellular nucleic acid binding protein, putative [Ricinus communis]
MSVILEIPQRKARKHQENKSHPDACLRCGGPGHEMFSCRTDYLPDDLKEIQCYVCKKFGHLCCHDFPDLYPTELSCYNCGQSGHLGSRLFCKECPNLCGATMIQEKPLLCATDGEQGPLAPTCSNHVKNSYASFRCDPGTLSPWLSSSSAALDMYRLRVQGERTLEA